MTLLFQYGSNTSQSRLNSQDRLMGDATPLGLFETTREHRLEFSVPSKTNNCAAANLAAAPGRRIRGVVYEVPDHVMSKATAGPRRSMDEIEGSRYHREAITLLDPAGLLGGRPVLTYLVTSPKAGLLTSLAYVTHIISGLRSFDAPAEYIQYVKDCAVRNNPGLAAGLDTL